MPDRFPSRREPTEEQIADGLDRLARLKGCVWARVEPTQVTVRRSSGAIERNWFAVGYDARGFYAVVDTAGVAKVVSDAELGTMNLRLPTPAGLAATQTPADERTAIAVGKETRDALRTLGLVDTNDQQEFMKRVNAVAAEIAKGVDLIRPDAGDAALVAMSRIFRGRVDLTAQDVRNALQNSDNLRAIHGPMEEMGKAAAPLLKAILEHEHFESLVHGFQSRTIINAFLVELYAEITKQAAIRRGRRE